MKGLTISAEHLLNNTLLVSALLFGLGLLLVILRKATLALIAGIICMTLGVCLSFVAFGNYAQTNQGDLFAVAVMLLVAINGVVGFALWSGSPQTIQVSDGSDSASHPPTVISVEQHDG